MLTLILKNTLIRYCVHSLKPSALRFSWSFTVGSLGRSMMARRLSKKNKNLFVISPAQSKLKQLNTWASELMTGFSLFSFPQSSLRK